LTQACLFHHEDVLPSTNDWLKARAQENAPAWTVITADRQTAGKGRHGRTWHSPEGNLYLSLLVRPKRTRQEWARLSLLTGVALYRAMPEAVRGDCLLKWPNDLLLKRKKLAGVLLESGEDWLVVGVGVNLTQTPENTELLYPPTSLKDAGQTVTAKEMRDAFLASFQPLYETWEAGGFTAIRQQWLDKSFPVGTQMSVRLGEELLQGDFAGLTAHGALQLTTPSSLQEIAVGDVVKIG